MSRTRAMLGLLVVAALGSAAILATGIAGAAPPGGPPGQAKKKTNPDATATPIKHVVVIFQENVSFDHYFGTYPNASGGDGQPFSARPGTPAVAGLTPATDASIPASLRHSSDLTTALANPNANPPLRLDSSPDGLPGDAGGLETCDQDHNYSDEQQSFNGGLMNLFVQAVGQASGKTPNGAKACAAPTVMDYYDGNSTTALWNYAQHYSMSDNSFGTTFGPSAPGAINLVAGDTGGVDTAHESSSPSVATSTAPNADITPDGKGGFSLSGDAQPYYDDCSTRDAVALSGTNIGDELNADGLSWGWFQGGFRPTTGFAAAATATGHAGQPTSTFIPDEFKAAFTGKVLPPTSTNNTVAGHRPVGARNDLRPGALQRLSPDRHGPRRARRHHVDGAVGLEGRLHRPPRAVPVLRLDGEPAPPAAREPRLDRRRHADVRSRQAPVRYGEPQLRHVRLRLARLGDQRRLASGLRTPGGHLPEGPGLRGRPRAVLQPA